MSATNSHDNGLMHPLGLVPSLPFLPAPPNPWYCACGRVFLHFRGFIGHKCPERDAALEALEAAS